MTARSLAVVLCALPLCAQPLPDHVLEVTGTAEVKVVPNQVVLVAGVETRDRSLATARQQNDDRIRRVLTAIRSFQIDQADVQTGYINVDIEYDRGVQTIVDHYRVEKAVSVTLRNVSQFESLLAAVLDAGANHIYSVDFSTTEIRKHRDQAREMAVKAAIEKANALAAAAGLKVSNRPLAVTSESFGGGFWNRGFTRGAMANALSNTMGNTSSEDSGATVALGKITITATVNMRFRLE